MTRLSDPHFTMPDLRERLKASVNVANDTDGFRTPFGDECRKRDAIRAVRERYWSLKNKLAARMERELARIEK